MYPLLEIHFVPNNGAMIENSKVRKTGTLSLRLLTGLLIDFTLSNARQFNLIMGKPLVAKWLRTTIVKPGQGCSNGGQTLMKQLSYPVVSYLTCSVCYQLCIKYNNIRVVHFSCNNLL